MSSPYPDNPFSVPGVAPPVKKKMSPFLKVILTLCVVFGICGVCCCGVLGGGAYLAWPVMEGPKVKDLAKSIVDIEVPKAFEPYQGYDWSLFQSKWVIYALQNRPGIVLLQCPPENMKAGFGKQLIDTLEADMRKGSPDDKVEFEKKTEEREFEIGGEKCVFEFRRGKGETNKAEFLMVSGEFPAKGGQGHLAVVAPISVVSEAEIEAMIKSIKK